LIGDDSTAEKRSEKHSAKVEPVDRESVALWNPDWRVICPDFEGAPAKLSEYAGRKNVLMTHPVSRNEPCGLERTFEVPKGQRTFLALRVAADERGDWELRVLVNGKILQKQLIDHKGDRWKEVTVDLTPYAGKKTHLRLENAANNWNYEFGYWSDIQLKGGEITAKAE
jgi:hypothetical protein